MAIHRFGLISDTHGRLHPRVPALFAGVEAILHAGDVENTATLTELSAVAPVHAVMGNCDAAGQPELPVRRTVSLPFGDAGIAHGHLHPSKIQEKAEALAAAFPGARLVLSGHSHQFDERTVDGILVVNPGAACPPRFGSDVPSVAILHWDDESDLLTVERIPLKWR